MFDWKAKDVVISIGEQQITGKDCVISEVRIDQPAPFVDFVEIGGKKRSIEMPAELVTIDISLKCLPTNFFYELFDENFKPKIRNKKVEDCSIPELLYAIRQKVNK